MARAREKLRRLLVEGRDEQRLIPYLVEENGIPWGETRADAIVDIVEFDGVENLLKPGTIEAELKSSNISQLGILLDADENLTERWAAVRTRCIQAFPNLPNELPTTGLVKENESGLRLGVWIMPDNQSSGMLETFLTFLVPSQSDGVYAHAVSSVEAARKCGAPCRDAHLDKAKIHTWLAWQDPPGRQLHKAIKERILAPESKNAQLFMRWFKELYALGGP